MNVLVCFSHYDCVLRFVRADGEGSDCGPRISERSRKSEGTFRVRRFPETISVSPTRSPQFYILYFMRSGYSVEDEDLEFI